MDRATLSVAALARSWATWGLPMACPRILVPQGGAEHRTLLPIKVPMLAEGVEGCEILYEPAQAPSFAQPSGNRFGV